MLVLRHPPCVTLFPYTTLFRSRLRLFRCLQTDLGPAAAPDKRTFVAQPRFRQRREHFAIQPLLSPDEMFQPRSEEHTSELQSRGHLVCRLLLEKKKHFNS